jgi:hypothetical protein
MAVFVLDLAVHFGVDSKHHTPGVYAMNDNRVSIRPVLYGNAVFSFISGMTFTLASKTVASFLGVGGSTYVILVLGIGLIGFATLLFFFASRPTIPPQFVLFVIGADSLWVLLSILLLTTGWIPFSVEGKWAVGIVALIVDVFAALQFLRWRKMGTITYSEV